MHKIKVITGTQGIGKSCYCRRLLDKTKKDGLKAGGFIAPAIYQDGVKTAFYTQSASTPEKRLCGKRVKAGGTIGCWQIDPETIRWGNELLKTACPCDVLFIDELGPLEFDRREGYTQAFDTLKQGDYGIAYVVIRPSCLNQFRLLHPDFDLITLGEENVSLD